MSTFVIIGGLTLSLAIVLMVAFKVHETEVKDGNSQENIDRDIENLSQNIDQEIQNLEREIEEFEL